MAKDRRREGRVSKRQFLLRISALAVAILAGIVLLIVVIMNPAGDPVDGPLVPPVTTLTTAGTSAAVTATTTATSEETTTSTSEETTTSTTQETTTATSTTQETTTTAPTTPSYGDGEWNRLLVNPWNPLSQEQVEDESNLVYAENGQYVDYRILDQLNAMLEAGAEYGLYVTSGYRSYETQEYLYNNKVDRVIASEGCSYEEALDIAATVVARPGTSEHHTGLAVDLLHNECWELEEYWEDSAAFDWMMEHCADYGFILRYPKESQHITGVIYEPWHYRYVGVEAAKAIMNEGITLEEYLGAY